MVSGPDLGAGFLYQLTRERRGPLDRFVFHAQNGGVDANGPPKGSPEPFGWAQSARMCPFGGRLCWHREFELPGSETLHVRTAYNRTRFVMESSIEQAYGGRPVPYAEALALLVPEGTGFPDRAWLTGSIALALQGSALAPTSVEIDAPESAIRTWAGSLEPYVIEPPGRTTWYGGLERFGARAFVGTLREGTRVEWSERAPRATGTGPTQSSPEGRSVTWNGRAWPVRSAAWVLVESFEQLRPELFENARSLGSQDPGFARQLTELMGDRGFTAQDEASLRSWF
jgi:hypothetical protein